MDNHRDTRSYDRRGQDPRGRRSGATRRKRKKHGRAFKVVMTVVLIFVITMAMLLCMSAAYIKNVIIPDAGLDMSDFNPNLTSTVMAKNPETGAYEAVQTLYGEENRVWVAADEIPRYLKDAAVAIEDKRFYKHNGVDWVRTGKAISLMFTGKNIQGGSTLTQQLIKNMTSEDEVTVKRKVMEIFRALEFEKKYTKDDILEAYLNYIYLGQGCNGVYTAAYTYFGKHVSQLDLAECACIIGITNNPSKYDPLGRLSVTDPNTGEVKTSKDFNKERQLIILNAMLEQGYITKEEYDQAAAEELVFNNPYEDKDGDGQPDSTKKKGTVYSWYVDQVINDVIQDLCDTYNWSEQYAKTKVFSGGLEIYTCMKPDVQAAVDEVYQNSQYKDVVSSSGQSLQSAITIVDNEHGEVVAMAGGLGEKTVSRSLNRATSSKRPPGSSIKPLSVYAPAIELGKVKPTTMVVDSPVDKIDGRDWPVNAAGGYRGNVTVSYAVEQSLNTVAVKVLDMVTPETSFDFMQDKFHIKLIRSLTRGDQKYSDVGRAQLALGGLTEGVTTLDMAAAYATFPNQGTYKTPKTYTMVLDSNGQPLLRNETEDQTDVLSQRTTYYMTEMLQRVISDGTGKKANFSGQEIAGKTGTTTSRKDLWFVGYTPYYTAAIWTGYDRQERLASGLNNPSPVLWNEVMSKIHQGLPYKDFDKPDNLKRITYCLSSGMLPGPYCSGHLATGTFLPEDAPSGTCTYHKGQSTRPSGGSSNGGSSHQNGGGTTSNNGGTTNAGGGTTDTGGGADTGTTTTPEAPPADTAGGETTTPRRRREGRNLPKVS